MRKHESKVQAEYRNRWGMAIMAMADYRRAELEAFGYDLRFVIRRYPRKKQVVLEVAEDAPSQPDLPAFCEHLIVLGRELGRRKRTLVAVDVQPSAYKATITYQNPPRSRRKVKTKRQ